MYLAYKFYLNDNLTVGDFVMFNSYAIQIYAPLGSFGSLWRWIKQSMVNVEQILNILETDDKILEPENPETANISKGMIEFRNVSFTYDDKLKAEDQKNVIENISFQIPGGKSVGIVGQTGSGKSTIMRLLYRFYDIQEG
jgi:ABC-type multidrug transport system fused ATPase/permease subunit